MSDQDFKTVFGDPEQKILDASKLETITIPDIVQEIAGVKHENPDRHFVCRCGSETCPYSIEANSMAVAGYSDFEIINHWNAVRVR